MQNSEHCGSWLTKYIVFFDGRASHFPVVNLAFSLTKLCKVNYDEPTLFSCLQVFVITDQVNSLIDTN